MTKPALAKTGITAANDAGQVAVDKTKNATTQARAAVGQAAEKSGEALDTAGKSVNRWISPTTVQATAAGSNTSLGLLMSELAARATTSREFVINDARFQGRAYRASRPAPKNMIQFRGRSAAGYPATPSVVYSQSNR